MSAEPQELHVAFFPLMGHGHMIPILNMAKRFVAHKGVKATIITTTHNVPAFSEAIKSRSETGAPAINLEVFKFPAQEVGLPEGYESLKQVWRPEFIDKFFKAAQMLSEQLEQYLEKVRPNCLVAAASFPWTADCAAKFNIPRLVFYGISNFGHCAQEVIRLHKPYKNVSSDEELFTLPFLPHEIQLTRLQIPEDFWKNEDSEFLKRMNRNKESEKKSFGVIVNSFYELEPDYADFFRKELGRRTWNIGPVSLSNRTKTDKARRGKDISIDEHECLQWLNSKKPNSIIYISFGSTASLIAPQLYEIAMALESSGHEFIWVVPKDSNGGSDKLPEGFEQRMEKKGLIIRGWAPQVLILEHEAIGCFVTHCGWNSTLEGISAGVPLVTWPLFAEQFYNEKLVTQVLKIGIPVGAKKWNKIPSVEEMVYREAIETAFREIMDGREVEERRARATKLKEMAQKAFEEGGSSYLELSSLINELRSYHTQQQD